LERKSEKCENVKIENECEGGMWNGKWEKNC
jgi:hypothetical protein